MNGSPTGIRERSRAILEPLGYPVPLGLPLLGACRCRGGNSIIERALVLAHVVGCAYQGGKAEPRKHSLRWLGHEKLLKALSRRERQFLETGALEFVELFQAQEEALWTMAWILNFLETMAIDSPCDERLVTFFPSVRQNESSERFRAKAKLRHPDDLNRMLDLLFCAHSAARDAQLRGAPIPGRVAPHVVIERRRALQWACSTDDWDELSLDT